MNPAGLIIGGTVLLVVIWLAVRWKDTASIIHKWYHTISQPSSDPWWMRGHFRPTERQAAFVAWLLLAIGAWIGIALLLGGLGVDLGRFN